MAKAGYDPRAAQAFWKRMADAQTGNAPPEFLSEHPGEEERIQKIQGWLGNDVLQAAETGPGCSDPIHLREGVGLAGEPQSLACQKMATPTGFESPSNVAKPKENSDSPSESLLPTHTKKRFTKADGSKVAKLAVLAANAVRNIDLHRALELIEEIRAVGEGSGAAGLPSSIRG